MCGNLGVSRNREIFVRLVSSVAKLIQFVFVQTSYPLTE